VALPWQRCHFLVSHVLRASRDAAAFIGSSYKFGNNEFGDAGNAAAAVEIW
jgi:hypothetical protein